MSVFTWTRFGHGYECSSKGDKRFSAFNARLPGGRTIEEVYQCDIKGYDPGGTNWRLGKGKPPLDTTVDLWDAYLELWWKWASVNSQLMDELRQLALAHNGSLRDCFASTPVNQAHALSIVLNRLYPNQKQNI